jgi:hypothetical protein
MPAFEYIVTNVSIAFQISAELTWTIEYYVSFDLRKARLVVGPHRRLFLIVAELVHLHPMRMSYTYGT